MASVYEFDEALEGRDRSLGNGEPCKRPRLTSSTSTSSSSTTAASIVLPSTAAAASTVVYATPIWILKNDVPTLAVTKSDDAKAVARREPMKLKTKRTKKAWKRKRTFEHNGYVYWMYNQTPTGRTYWICRYKGCRAKFNFDSDGAVTKRTAHTHHAELESLPKLDPELTVTPNEPAIPTKSSAVMDPATTKQMESDVPVKQIDSTRTDRVQEDQRRVRSNLISQAEHMARMDAEWSRRSVAMIMGVEELNPISTEAWLIADEAIECQGGTRRFLMFGDNFMLQQLSKSTEWWIDGSFNTRPQHFKQLLVVFYDHEGDIFPAAYGLLPFKSKAIYDSFFEILKAKFICMGCSTSGPDLIHLDFKLEAWCRSTLELEFPSATIVGRYHHFVQANYKRLQALDSLSRRYMHDAKFRMRIRKLWALAMLPKEEVPSAFEELAADFASSEPDITKYVSYFRTTWIMGPMSPAVWNISCLENRINNAIEMWHSRLSRSIFDASYNIPRFLWRVRKELQFAKYNATCLRPCRNRECRNSRDDATEQTLNEAKNAYETKAISRSQFLEQCASLLNRCI